MNQKEILTECVERFFQEEYVIINYYVNDGRTGTDYDCPGSQHMTHDVESGEANCVICKNLACALHNYADQGYFLENYFLLYSTHFTTLDESEVGTYLNPKAVNGMEVLINGLTNDRFAYSTSNSIRRTSDTRRRDGELIGAFASYGYGKHPVDKNALAVDEEAARMIRDIFQWLVYGDGSAETAVDENGVEQEVLKGNMSKEGIVRKLNEVSVSNPVLYKMKRGYRYRDLRAEENDGLWMGTPVPRLLKNKVYVRTMAWGEQRIISYKMHDIVNVPEEEWYQVNNTHEATTPLEFFEKSQELHVEDTRTAPGEMETYLLSGFPKCADCGRSVIRRALSGFVYYNCSIYKKRSKDEYTKHAMWLDVLEKTVLLVTQERIELVESLEEALNNINQVPVVQIKPTRLGHLLKLREQGLEKTEDSISGFHMDQKNGDITRGRHRKMKEKSEQQEEQLKEVIKHIRDEVSTTGSGITPGDLYLQAFLKRKNIQELS